MDHITFSFRPKEPYMNEADLTDYWVFLFLTVIKIYSDVGGP